MIRHVPVRAPVFDRHQFFGTSEHYEKAHGSLLSGWMNYNYTVCCWFPTSSNILIPPSQFWQIRLESCWLHCSKCRILVLLRVLRARASNGWKWFQIALFIIWKISFRMIIFFFNENSLHEKYWVVRLNMQCIVITANPRPEGDNVTPNFTHNSHKRHVFVSTAIMALCYWSIYFSVY